MALTSSHDTSMKIHDRNVHILLTMEAFSKTVIMYAFQQKKITNRVRME